MKKCCSVLVFILFLSFMFVLKVEAKMEVNCTYNPKTEMSTTTYFFRSEILYDFKDHNNGRNADFYTGYVEHETDYGQIYYTLITAGHELTKNVIFAENDGENEVYYQILPISKEKYENGRNYWPAYKEYYYNIGQAYSFYTGLNERNEKVYMGYGRCNEMQELKQFEEEEQFLRDFYREAQAKEIDKNRFINSIPSYNSSNWKKATVESDYKSFHKIIVPEGYYVIWIKTKFNVWTGNEYTKFDSYSANVFHFEKQKVNETKNLEIGATYTLPVKGNGYKSSNTAVATVSNDGIITAKSGGTATITYTTDTTNYTIVINTYEMQIGTAPLLGDPITLKSGETATANNIEIKDNLTWFSDDEKIASVKNGVITGGYKGKTMVHAYNDTTSYTVEVEVTSKPKAQGSKEIETILDGAVNIKDFYDKSVLDTVISVKSENEKIATIDTSLNVKGKSVGSTNVVIEYEDHFLEIAVKVLNKVEIKDENTSIPDENKNYLKLETKKIEENTKDYEEVKKKIKGINSFALYDINLYKDNQKIQPDSPIYLLLDIPKGYDQNKIVVYRIEENGSMTKLESTVENGKIKFLTNHFSYYIVAEETVQGESKTESVNIKNLSNTTSPTTENNTKEEIENPQTGKVISITLILISILLIGAIIIYTRKNKKIFSI